MTRSVDTALKERKLDEAVPAGSEYQSLAIVEPMRIRSAVTTLFNDHLQTTVDVMVLTSRSAGSG